MKIVLLSLTIYNKLPNAHDRFWHYIFVVTTDIKKQETFFHIEAVRNYRGRQRLKAKLLTPDVDYQQGPDTKLVISRSAVFGSRT